MHRTLRTHAPALAPALALALALVPRVSVAAGGGGHQEGIPWTPILLHTVNLIVFLGVLAWLVLPAVRNALKNRSLTVQKEIDEAMALHKAAEHRLAEVDRRLAGMDREVEALRAEARGQAERAAQLVRQHADADAEALLRSAEAAIRAEVEAARVSLQRRAVELAVGRAEEQLPGRITESTQAGLAQDLLGTINGKVNRG